jgi:RNA polymerase sigma-70 factor (ECF subfamily)
MTRQLQDRELVERSLAGDERAMREMFERHHKKIYAMALRLTGSVSDAEDVVQETFIRAFRHLKTFRGDSRLSTWLCRIAINQSRDVYKKQARTSPERDVPVEPGQKDALARARLEKALEALPDGYREVLVMHDVIGMGHREIAEVLKTAEGTSKSQLHKARARMRELLSGSAA